jgi:hypothetical protein
MDNSSIKEPIHSPVTVHLSVWVLLAISGLILSATALAWNLASNQFPAGQEPEQAVISQSAFEEVTGVHIVRIALTAEEGMIDLRYLVIDPDKAVIIHEGESPPAIMDEATGKILDTSWMNHTHSGEYQAGVTYYTLLMNSGGVLSKGSKVTVILGGVRLEHLVVQ